jgi:hypothetical protein
VAVEATQAIGDVDLGAKDKSCALIEHGAGEAERCHRVLRWMLDELPLLGTPAVRVLPPRPLRDIPEVVSL